MTKTAIWRKNPDTGEWCAYIPGKELPAGTEITLERKDGTSSAATIVAIEKVVARGILYSFKHVKSVKSAPPEHEQVASIPEIVPVSVPASVPVSDKWEPDMSELDMDELDIALGIGAADFPRTELTVESYKSEAEYFAMLDKALGIIA